MHFRAFSRNGALSKSARWCLASIAGAHNAVVERSIPTQPARLVIVLRSLRLLAYVVGAATRRQFGQWKNQTTHIRIDLPRALTRSTDSLQLRKLLSLSRSGNRRLTSIREYGDV